VKFFAAACRRTSFRMVARSGGAPVAARSLWIGLLIDTLLYFAALVGLRYVWLRFMKRTPNHAAQRTRTSRSGCRPRHRGPPSLSLGR
jgi:hypothetical protein